MYCHSIIIIYIQDNINIISFLLLFESKHHSPIWKIVSHYLFIYTGLCKMLKLKSIWKNKIHCKYYARWSSTKYLENYTSLNRWKLLHVVLRDILRFPKNSIDYTYSNAPFQLRPTHNWWDAILISLMTTVLTLLMDIYIKVCYI